MSKKKKKKYPIPRRFTEGGLHKPFSSYELAYISRFRNSAKEEWIASKKRLMDILEVLDGVFEQKKFTSQQEIIDRIFAEDGLPEPEDISANSFLFSHLELLSDSYRLTASRLGNNKLDDDAEEVLGKNSVLDAFSDDIVSSVIDYWDKYKSIVPMNSVYAIISNKELVDVIVQNKIKFVTQNEPHLSKLICDLIHYLDNSSEITHGNPKFGDTMIQEANDFAREMGPLFDSLTEEGFKSIRAKAEELNKRDITTLRGKKWTHTSVHKTLSRWNELKDEDKMKSVSDSPKP